MPDWTAGEDKAMAAYRGEGPDDTRPDDREPEPDGLEDAIWAARYEQWVAFARSLRPSMLETVARVMDGHAGFEVAKAAIAAVMRETP